MGLQILINISTLIGTLLAIIGILITFNKIKQIRRQNYQEQVSDLFEMIYTTPPTNIASYKEVYIELSRYYQNLKNNKEIIYFDKEYLSKCISIHNEIRIQFREDELHYNFPIATKRNWVLSNNSKFEISVELFTNEQVTYNLPKIFSTKFLNFFKIKNYSSYIGLKGKNLWNSLTFDLIKINENANEEKIGLNFGLGNYFGYVNSNELLSKELYLQMSSKVFSDYSQIPNNHLPKIYSLRNTISMNDLFNFENHPNSIGFHVFVIMEKENNKHGTFIQKRNDNLLEYPGFYHVAPAGTFQPLSEFDTETMKKQCNFPYTVLRELLEEIFDLESADKSRSSNPFEIFNILVPIDSDDSISPGKELGITESMDIENEFYKIIPTCLFIDLLTLKPQISFVLHIKKASFYEKIKTIFLGNWEGNIKEFEIESDGYQRFLERNLNINGFPPAGAVTIAEGINYYKKIKNKATS